MTTNLYPVDDDDSVSIGAGIRATDLDNLIAATRTTNTGVQCANGSLSEGDAMIAPMTTTARPPLPAGATDASEFDDNTRVVHGPLTHAGTVSVYASAIQATAGALVDNPRLGRIGVQLGGGDTELTPTQARVLAQALLESAALAEQWEAQPAN